MGILYLRLNNLDMAEANNPLQSVVCNHAEIQGKVRIGKGCIIHPGCSIICEAGEIIIGDNNIIEERVVIYNKAVRDRSGQVVPGVLKIGNYNLFEIGCVIETSEIGDYNIFNPKSHLEYSCRIKNGCNIGASVKVPMSKF
eukprot:TRINITY_DN1350_c0_g2_i4.p1 TRINITY_DN1350_c0_g2~~TRINITY_DN1350_c0_g2_i4.p1  ORF type:complete len:141 (+),score=18.72 TRINITY_DN1350_c0_g2_i4:100-522(+)